MQNPPSIPTLFIVWIVSRLQGARFIIDWHNFGYAFIASYTIMALSLGMNHPRFVSRVRVMPSRRDCEVD